MNLPAAVAARIEIALRSPIASAERLGGGQIAAVWRVGLQDGRAVVVKSGHELALEAWMLQYLKRHSRVPVPEVYLADDDLLAMEFVANDGRLTAEAESHLGEIVAGLHAIQGERFGFERDTLIGGLPQPNPPSADWPAFFRDHRLLMMGRAALAAGMLPQRLMTRLDALCGRLGRWIGNDAAPALIHGDLWAGNMLGRGPRITGLIDPALYFADPEIELAFMTLFGSVGERFFSSYGERRTMRPGFFEERRDLYNLYPLLVHVRLFGGAYVAQVDRTLARYGF
ncbi:MAG TPA: fructosamine kinase family protein [Alphaproteobacteria bacterium]|nr:fructosamine kinase family protein [Alphaproteobacteria bacterium]